MKSLFWILTHTASKDLEIIVEILFGNVVKFPKYFETNHKYCSNIVRILLCPHRICVNIYQILKKLENAYF